MALRLLHATHRSRVYQAWQHMLDRCLNPKSQKYRSYGGRGITVCDQWRSFTAFLRDMGEPPAGMSLDRIDNNGNYEPANCRWATAKEQANNRRNNWVVTVGGRTQTIDEWANELGINKNTVYGRIKRGRTAEEALFRPVMLRRIRVNGHLIELER